MHFAVCMRRTRIFLSRIYDLMKINMYKYIKEFSFDTLHICTAVERDYRWRYICAHHDLQINTFFIFVIKKKLRLYPFSVVTLLRAHHVSPDLSRVHGRTARNAITRFACSRARASVRSDPNRNGSPLARAHALVVALRFCD